MATNATKFNFDNPSAGSGSGSSGAEAAAALGLKASDRRNKGQATSALPTNSYTEYMEGKTAGNQTGASSYAGHIKQSNDYISSGLGASGDYDTKANEHIRNDPTTSPDFFKNWVNDGSKAEFANLHNRPTTNHWARLADAFNNHRWWNPGQESTAGPAGAGVTSTGDYGRGERWEPITTQELEAQNRAEEYESAVRGAGIERQDLYSRYPYDIHKEWQESQMRANYQHDLLKADFEVQYGTLMRKAAAASGATGVYGRALWALMSIGGYQMNDFDRRCMQDLEEAMSGRYSRAEQDRKVEDIFTRMAWSQGTRAGISAKTAYAILMDELGSGAYGNIPDNMGEILKSALGLSKSF